MAMLLAVDVGNTNVTIGVFDGAEMVTRFHFTVRISRTSDEYGSTICEILERKGFSADSIDQVIISSVVPKIMYSFSSGIIKYLGCQPIIVGAGIKTGIRIETANPREVGPDRIVDAVAAHTLYGGPIIVADYGTATTYDLITAEGAFLGGVISPGVKISAMRSGMTRRICRKLRSNVRSMLWQRIPLQRCRQDFFSVRSDSPSISSIRSRQNPA